MDEILLLKIHVQNMSRRHLFPFSNLSAFSVAMKTRPQSFPSPGALLRSFCFAVLSNLFAKMGFAAGAAENRAHAFCQWGGDWCGKKDGSPGGALPRQLQRCRPPMKKSRMSE
jgi:hypothetical protein